MKQPAFIFALLIVCCALNGCWIAGRQAQALQSVFFANFSIGPIVEANEGYLIAGNRELFGDQAGPPEPFTQRHEEIIVQVDSANLPAFVQAVRSDIERAIASSGASIVGIGSGGLTGTSFSYSYSQGAIYGVVNVWGVRGDGVDYTLIVLITESQENR